MLTDAAQPPLLLAVCGTLLVLFIAVASLDGLYYHLHRYRLHRRPASQYEHRLHTANALLFPPLTFLLFCVQPLGLWLWLILLLYLLTLVIESADVLCEYQSRADLGGLTRSEYLMHFLMSGLRSGAVVPLLVVLPAAAWRPTHTALVARPVPFAILGACIALPAVGTGLLHLWLCFPRRAP